MAKLKDYISQFAEELKKKIKPKQQEKQQPKKKQTQQQSSSAGQGSRQAQQSRSRSTSGQGGRNIPVPKPKGHLEKAKSSWKLGLAMKDLNKAYQEKIKKDDPKAAEKKVKEAEKELVKHAQVLEDAVEVSPGAKGWAKAASDPNFWTVNLTSTLPMNLSLIGTQLIGGTAGKALSIIPTPITKGIGGGIQVGTAGYAAKKEADMEAADSYQEAYERAIEKKASPKKAHTQATKVADEVRRKNMALLLGTNVLEQVAMFGGGKTASKAFDMNKNVQKINRAIEGVKKAEKAASKTPAGKVAVKTGKEVGRVAAIGGTESGQEAAQYAIQEKALDNPLEWKGPEAQEAMLAGFTMGATMGTGGRLISAGMNKGQEKLKNRLDSKSDSAGKVKDSPVPGIPVPLAVEQEAAKALSPSSDSPPGEMTSRGVLRAAQGDLLDPTRSDLGKLSAPGINASEQKTQAQARAEATAQEIIQSREAEQAQMQQAEQAQMQQAEQAQMQQAEQAQAETIVQAETLGKQAIAQIVENQEQGKQVMQQAEDLGHQAIAQAVMANQNIPSKEEASITQQIMPFNAEQIASDQVIPVQQGAGGAYVPSDTNIISTGEIAPSQGGIGRPNSVNSVYPAAMAPGQGEMALVAGGGQNVSFFGQEQSNIVDGGSVGQEILKGTPTNRLWEINVEKGFQTSLAKVSQAEGQQVNGQIVGEHQLTLDEQQIIVIGQALGIDVRFFTSDSTALGVEFVDPSLPGVVFVRRGTSVNSLWCVGHGFVHNLRELRPDLYQKLEDTIINSLTDAQIKQYATSFFTDENYVNFLLQNRELVIEEILSDEGGNYFVSEQFWGAIQERDPGLFTNLVNFVRSILERLNVKFVQNVLTPQQIQAVKNEFEAIVEAVIKDVDVIRTQQGVPQQGVPQQDVQQDIPQQDVPQQDIPQQGIQQGVPQQDVQQDIPQQDVQQDVPQQGVPQQGVPQQGVQQDVQQDIPQQGIQQDIPQQGIQQGIQQQQPDDLKRGARDYDTYSTDPAVGETASTRDIIDPKEIGEESGLVKKYSQAIDSHVKNSRREGLSENEAREFIRQSLQELEDGTRNAVFESAGGLLSQKQGKPGKNVPGGKRGAEQGSGNGYRVLGSGIIRNLINKGRVDLRGRMVNNAEDLAAIAQVYRNPKFETLRVIYLKGNEIVGHEGVTSRLPGTVSIAESPEALNRKLYEMKDRMRRMGADGYYLLHNHPSGRAEPSKPDLRMTGRYHLRVPGLKGHVIINSNEYSVINVAGQSGDQVVLDYQVFPKDFGEDTLLKPSKDHPLLGTFLNSSSRLADLASFLKNESDQVVIIFRGSSGKVRAIQEVPVGVFNSAKNATDYLRGRAREFGAQEVFAVAYDSKNNNTIKELIENGVVLDAIFYDKTYDAYETAVVNRKPVDPSHWMGVNIGTKRYQVEEASAAEQDPTNTPEFTKWFGDSKVVDESGRPLVVYHGTDADFDAFIKRSDANADDEIGFHFGTKEQAENRLHSKARRKLDNISAEPTVDDYSNMNVVPVYLSIKSPLKMKDSGRWDATSMATAIAKENPHQLNKEQVDKIYEIGYSLDENRTEKLRNYLSSIGFDGIEYNNEVEGKGSSYIAFSPEQIKSAYNQGTWDASDPDIRHSKRSALETSFSENEMAIANATSRATGAIGAKAITPRYVGETSTPKDTILDFGAGKAAMHTQRLKAQGLNVTAYEFGANIDPKLHDPKALSKQYDTVYASNVLNVQSSEDMLRRTLQQIYNSVKDGKRAVFNFPKEPRKLGLTPKQVVTVIEEVFGSAPKRVGGNSSAPLWEVVKVKKDKKDKKEASDVYSSPLYRKLLKDKSRKYGVGKDIGGKVYVHKQYEDVFADDGLEQAKSLLPKDFEYTAVVFEKSTGAFTFTYSPDFDTSAEPIVGDQYKVKPDGEVVFTREQANPYIWHHKWLWVKDDYAGFDVEKSIQRSIDWTSLPNINRNRIGRKKQWEAEVVPLLKKDSDASNPDIRFSKRDASEKEVAPPFYSQLERIIEQKMPNKATPDQIRSIVKSGQVKKEEIEWSGVIEWLDEQGKSVAKQDVLDFIKTNDIQVKEVIKSEKDSARYADYQLSGGEDYRELLFILPGSKPLNWDGIGAIMRKYNISGDYMPDESKDKVASRILSEYREKLTKQEVEYLGQAVSNKGYISSHWDESNVLAHVRFNDRISAEGEKVLHIEEVQSDWHQEGREKGYRRALTEEETQELEDLRKINSDLYFAELKTANEKEFNEKEFDVLYKKRRTILDRIEEIENIRNGARKVPDAPLKKTWHEFVLKRMLRYAAENGYDRVSWTTGGQQTERYNLSTLVNSITYFPATKNTNYPGVLSAYPRNGTGSVRKTINSRDELVGMVGKDVADRIEKEVHINNGADLSGLDLKIGGEGMRWFYDRMIPSFLNKYAKKWGAEVEEVVLGRDLRNSSAYEKGGSEEVMRIAREKDPANFYISPSLPITDSMRESVLYEGQPKFSKRNKNEELPSGEKTRAFHTTVTEDGGFSSKVDETLLGQKIEGGSGAYDPITLKGLDEEAYKKYTRSLEAAESFLENDKYEDAALSIAVARYVAKDYDAQAISLEYEGRYEEARDKIARSVEIIADVSRKLTQMGQAISATRLWQEMSAEKALLNAERAANRSYKKATSKKFREEVDEVTREISDNMNTINNEAVDRVLDSEDVQKAIQETLEATEAKQAEGVKVARKEQRQKARKAKESKEDPGRVEPAELLAHKVRDHLSDPKVRKDDPVLQMVKTLFEVAREKLPEREAVKNKSPINVLIDAMRHKETYQECWDESKLIFREKYGDDIDAGNIRMDDIEDYLNHFLEQPYAQRLLTRSVKRVIKDLGFDIKEAIATGKTGVLRGQVIREASKNAELSREYGRELNHAISKEFDREVARVRSGMAQQVTRRAVEAVEGKTENPSAARDMMSTMMAIAKERLPSKAKKAPRNEMELLAQAVKNRSHYRKLWNTAKTQVANKYKGTEEYQRFDDFFNRNIGVPYADSQLKRAVSQGIKNEEIVLRDLIRKHYTEVDRTNRILTEKLMQGLDIPEEQARALSIAVEKKFAEMTEAKKKQVLDTMLRQYSRKITKDQKGIIDRVVEWSNVGAFSDEKYRKAIAEQLGLFTITDGVAMDIIRLTDIIQTANDEIVREEASLELQALLEALNKPTLLHKISTVQNIAMLLRIITALRNIVGNEIFYRTDRVTRYVATPIDWAHSKLTGAERTVTFHAGWQSGFWEGLMKGSRYGWRGWNVRGLNTKYDLPVGLSFDPKSRNPAERCASMLERALRVELQGFDYAAYNRVYKQAIGEQAVLILINQDKPVTRKNVQEIMQTMDSSIEDYADQMGKYMTYQDDNVISLTLSRIKRSLNFSKPWGLGDMVIKFPRTPGALIARGLEYSPAGFLYGLHLATQPYRNGGKDVHPREVTMAISRAITGTFGLSGFGFVLASLGILTGEDPDRDSPDVMALKNAEGMGEYRINVTAFKRWVFSGLKREEAKMREKDLFVTWDWAEPLSVSIAIGTGIYDALSAKYTDDESSVSIPGAVVTGLLGGINTVYEQPLFQGIKRLFQPEFGSDASNHLAKALTAVLSEVPASFVPGTLYDVRKYIDPARRDTRDDDPLKQTLNRVINKIPGLSTTLPQQHDTLGRPLSMYWHGTNNLFNTFFNPSFTSRYEPSPEAQLVLDLYLDAQHTEQFPKKQKRFINYDGERYDLNSEQYQRLQKAVGEAVREEFAYINPDAPDEWVIEQMEFVMKEIGRQVREEFIEDELYYGRVEEK